MISLGGDVLEVGRATVEQERQLAVVDGDLGEAGRHRQEPQRPAAQGPMDAALLVLDDVTGGLCS
jgi:hypothetical protein